MPKRVAPTKRGVLKSPISRGAAAAVGAVAVVLAVAALIFTNASTSEDLVGDALLLQGAEATLGANNVALKALTQAVLLAEDELLGVADEETAELAVAEANETVAELGLVGERAPGAAFGSQRVRGGNSRGHGSVGRRDASAE